MIFKINSPESKAYAIKMLMDCGIDEGLEFSLDLAKPKPRTLPQNNSLHKYSTSLSDAFNDAGYDQLVIIKQFKESFAIPWNMYAIKTIFATVGEAMYGVTSTAKLSTIEMQKVYQVFDKKMSEITGIHVEWPSRESR